MKHTPGPWRAAPQPGQTVGVHTFTHCVMHGDDALCYTLTEADANLIAAAPDILAACKEAYFAWAHGVGSVTTSDDPDTRANADRNIREGKRIMGVIESAIRKAEGGAG